MKNEDRNKIFLDLSKCSEGEIKSLPQILKDGGDKIPLQMAGNFYNKDFPYLCFLAELKTPIWDCCRNAFNLTEISFPAFKEMLGSGEGERTELLTDVSYWRNRCLLAEKCLSVSPCDPDITDGQINAHIAYNQFLEAFGNKD